jgi:hypothetical protein
MNDVHLQTSDATGLLRNQQRLLAVTTFTRDIDFQAQRLTCLRRREELCFFSAREE